MKEFKQIRLLKRITIKKLAQITSINRKTIIKFENGGSIQLELAQTLLKAIDCELRVCLNAG